MDLHRQAGPAPNSHRLPGCCSSGLVATNYLFEDLKRLQEKLEGGCPIYDGPLALVTPPSDEPRDFEPISLSGSVEPRKTAEGGDIEELYFPLPYNDEQVTIVQRLKTRRRRDCARAARHG